MNKAESEWQTYRSKFLIKAKQLSGPLSFVDALGREHRGKKGDYLVESENGSLRIWPRKLFEDAHALFHSSLIPAGQAEGPSPSSAPPKKRARREIVASLCGKNLVQPGTPAVNCLRYNI